MGALGGGAMKRVAAALFLLLFTAAGFVAIAYLQAVQAPLVRRASLALVDWPAGTAPVTVALISDLHLGNLATDEARLARVARQVTALRPDLILIAGDFSSDEQGDARDAMTGPRLVAPLSLLRARLGTVAVLGNHDWWAGAAMIRQALTRAGVTVLSNGAVRRGPLMIGGLDDDYTGRDDLPATVAAMRRGPGARVLLAHTPDSAPTLPPDVALLLAGHTHCGQLVLPVIGAPVSVSRHGNRYRCGIIREGARRVVVTAGIGASSYPLRFGAPPDLWLLTLGPPPLERASRPRS